MSSKVITLGIIGSFVGLLFLSTCAAPVHGAGLEVGWDDEPVDYDPCDEPITPYADYLRKVDGGSDPVEIYRLYRLTMTELCEAPPLLTTFAERGFTDDMLRDWVFGGGGNPDPYWWCWSDCGGGGPIPPVTPPVNPPAPVPLPAGLPLLAGALGALAALRKRR